MRLQFRKIPHRWTIVLVIIVAGSVSVVYSVRLRDVNNLTKQNHQLVCLLDRLFGLDKPIPAKQLRRLSADQKAALKEIIADCSELQKGHTP
jgi:hypothetical protein